MKKVNGGYIVKQFVITVIAALIIGVAAWLALSVRAGQFSEPTLIVFSVMACFFRGGILWNTSCMGRIWKEIPENI